MWIILVAVPTIVALYYMAKANNGGHPVRNRTNRRKEIVIKVELDELPPDTDATQTEWEFKQYHKN